MESKYFWESKWPSPVHWPLKERVMVLLPPVKHQAREARASLMAGFLLSRKGSSPSTSPAEDSGFLHILTHPVHTLIKLPWCLQVLL